MFNTKIKLKWQVWKTKDGAIFETEKEANDHEAGEALIKNMTEYFFMGTQVYQVVSQQM